VIRKTDLWKPLTYLVIFLIPTQLAIHFWPSFAFVYGIRVDYLSPSIYLTDILIWLLLILKPHKLITFLKRSSLVKLVLLVIAFNVFFSSGWIATSLRWLKLIEFALFSLLIYTNKKELSVNSIISSVLYSSSFFSLVGICQFFIGKTTGLLWILGERSFTLSSPGIALVQILGQDFLRTYSTFPHPNAFGGYLGTVLLFLFFQKKFPKSTLNKILVAVVFVGFILTFSFSAVLAILLCLIVYFFYKKTIKNVIYIHLFFLSILASLTFPIYSRQLFGPSKILGSVFSERVELAFFAGKMISAKFLFGEGLNAFIPNIPRFVGIENYSWLLQPVHNIFLLVFSEVGIIGFIFFSVVLYKLFKQANVYTKTIFLFVITTGLMDHYWLTLQQNNLWLAFLIGFLL